MSESSIVECARCSIEGDVLADMHAIGGVTLGPVLDLGIGVRYYCPPCFYTVRADSRERTRMTQWLDAVEKWSQVSVAKVSDNTLKEMENLPEGLKVTPSDRVRHARLKDKLDKVEELQDPEDLACLVRICRNINKNPFQHPVTGKRKNYEDLKEDLKKLEKLSPEERLRLDG